MSTSQLQSLMQRVATLTRSHGSKAALARHLGVERQRLNDWIQGRFSPGGEITLQLLEWVTAEEEKQKALGSADNTAKSKQTRKRKRSNVKPNSGPG